MKEKKKGLRIETKLLIEALCTEAKWLLATFLEEEGWILNLPLWACFNLHKPLRGRKPFHRQCLCSNILPFSSIRCLSKIRMLGFME